MDAYKNLKEALSKIGPKETWVASGNYPFYAVLSKPRPSLSKHDDRPSYWHWDDVNFILTCVNDLPELLKEYEEIKFKLDRLNK